MALRLSSLSTEYVRVPVSARENGAVVDPTSDPVSMAFKAEGAEPEEVDWVAGSWETDGETFYARCLIGPDGDQQLADGTYLMWVRIAAAPEEPVRRVGRLVVD
jgi:hypothetical protein